MANNISVKDAAESNQVVKTTDNSGVHTPHVNVDNLPADPPTATNQAAGNTSLSNLDTNIGAKDDSAASTDTGTFSLIGLFKRLLQNITNLLQSTGDENDAAASSDTGSFSIIAFIKRSLQNWTTLQAKVPTLTTLTAIPADDTDGDGLAVRLLPMHTSRISFAKAISGGVDPEWGDEIIIGSGMGVNQTGGNLVITAGTTTRSETIIRSIASWKGGIRLSSRSTLSQRNTNNSFFVELVDVIGDGLSYTITSATNIDVTFTGSHGFTSENVGQSMYLGAFVGTGTFLSGRYTINAVSGNVVSFTVSGFAAGSGTCSAFGWNYYHLVYTGTGATTVLFDTQRRGYNSGDTSATISTTASPGHLAVITANDARATFSDQLVASSTTIAQTVRATRAENVPDDHALRLQVRALNGTTAPTATTWTIGFLNVSNYANQDVVLQDVRPMTNAQALPVEILRSAQLTVSNLTTIGSGVNAIGDVGIQYRTNATGAATITNVNCPATPAAQQIKSGAGRITALNLHNNAASTRWLKFFNLASASVTPGTTSATFEIGLSPGQTFEFTSEGGLGFSTGSTIMITGAAGLTNNTAVTAGDVTGFTGNA